MKKKSNKVKKTLDDIEEMNTGDILSFDSEEEFYEWLEENGISEEELMEKGTSVQRITKDSVEGANDWVDVYNRSNPTAKINYLTSEQLDIFYSLDTDEEKMIYIESLRVGLS